MLKVPVARLGLGYFLVGVVYVNYPRLGERNALDCYGLDVEPGIQLDPARPGPMERLNLFQVEL